MPLNLTDALPRYGGFNRLEKEEYYRLFISGAEDTAKMLTLAAEVAEAKNWSQEEAIDKLMRGQDGNGAAMLALGPELLNKLIEFDEAKKNSQRMEGYTLARLICLSRISLDWVKNNADALAEYGVEITPEMVEAAATVRKVDRLDRSKNQPLVALVDEVLALLPSNIIGAAEELAIDELNEGRKAPSTAVEDRKETPLAAPAESSQKPATPTTQSVSSGTNATSASKPVASKTLAITGRKSA